MSDGIWNSNMSLHLGESNYKRCTDSYDCFLVHSPSRKDDDILNKNGREVFYVVLFVFMQRLEETSHIIQTVCQAVSIAAILPAIIILLSYRFVVAMHILQVYMYIIIQIRGK